MTVNTRPLINAPLFIRGGTLTVPMNCVDRYANFEDLEP